MCSKSSAVHLHKSRYKHHFFLFFTCVGNNDLVSQYTDDLEVQHAYVKETVDVTFPQNIKILQGVLDKLREKIQRLEKAVTAQTEKCAEPCVVSCPIPVVSGKDCEDIYRNGGEASQMYLVRPELSQTPYKVYCEQTTQNGGESGWKQTI